MCPGILQRRGLRLRQRLEGYAPGWQPHETSRSPQQDVETAFWQSFHFKSCGSFKAFEATPTITRNLLPGYVARDKAENENGGCQHQPNVVHRSHNAGPLAKSPRSLRSFCRALLIILNEVAGQGRAATKIPNRCKQTPSAINAKPTASVSIEQS